MSVRARWKACWLMRLKSFWTRDKLASIRADAGDPPPRHFERATRALHCAIRRYVYLKEHGL